MIEHTDTLTDKQLIIEIFEPPMCCPGGLCGPAIDPALLAINETILKLKSELQGKVRIERYLLSQQGDKFMKNPDVLALLQKEGTAALPVTIINGKMLKKKAYPAYEDLIQALKE